MGPRLLVGVEGTYQPIVVGWYVSKHRCQLTMSATHQYSGERGVEAILDALDVTVDELDAAASTVRATVELFDNHRECQTSLTLADGTQIHKFQMVRHEMELPFGDNEVTDWVITKIDVGAMEVTLKVPGPWDQTTVSFEELMDGEYEPLTHSDGVPRFGY
jgi:hypothetical protein